MNDVHKMYFKLEYLLNELLINFDKDERIVFTFGETYVSIRPLSAEEKKRYNPKRYLIGTAVTELEPSQEVAEICERFTNKRMPRGFKKPKQGVERYDYIDAQGNIANDHIPPLSLFPDSFRTFASDVKQELSNIIKETVRILRWRNNLRGAHNPVAATHGMSYSFDNNQYEAMPSDYFVKFSSPSVWKVSDSVCTEIQSLVKSKVNEPLGHELLLEAFGLQTANPRSALIIGMSAAEVGFKQCIGLLIPDAVWLANYVPSPPLPKMLSDFLPILPVKLKIQERVLKPPKTIRTAIKKGVEARNGTIHAGIGSIQQEELDELLLCIRDLLYLLDFYCGHAWAIHNLRGKVKQEMVNEFNLDATRPF